MFGSYETRLSIGLIAAWAILLPGAILAIQSEYVGVRPATQIKGPNRSLPEITRLHFEQYDASGLVVSVKADSMAITPRRILSFNLQAVNEAHLSNALIDVHLRNRTIPDVDLTSWGNVSTHATPRGLDNPLPSFGLITRTLIRGIKVSIFDDTALAMTLRADEAYVDKRWRTLRCQRNVRLKDARSGREIVSREIVWNTNSNSFVIPGDYLALTDAGRAKGNGARVNLDFVVTALSP